MLRITELLIHSEDVPLAARMALLSASSGPLEERADHLLEAAKILHHDSGLPCEDAMELVGLEDCHCTTEC